MNGTPTTKAVVQDILQFNTSYVEVVAPLHWCSCGYKDPWLEFSREEHSEKNCRSIVIQKQQQYSTALQVTVNDDNGILW